MIGRWQRAHGEWLHLFTSNRSDLYTRDAVDAVAHPTGARRRFRYQSKYVDIAIADAWRSNDLTGTRVAVYFTILHPAGFHRPMYIPLRTGVVEHTSVTGDIFVVYFSLKSFMHLSDAPDVETRAQRVQALAEEIDERLPARNPTVAKLASRGPSVQDLVQISNSEAAFEPVIRYLTPSLDGDRYIFFRLAGAKSEFGRAQRLRDGTLKLIAGRRYALELVHYQESPLTEAVTLNVSVPSSLTLLDDTEVVLRSRYDVIPIDVFAPARDAVAAGTVLITTQEPHRGPTVRVPVIVGPSRPHRLAWPIVAVFGAVAIAVPPLLTDKACEALKWAPVSCFKTKLMLVIVGTFVAAGVLYRRRSKGLPA